MKTVYKQSISNILLKVLLTTTMAFGFLFVGTTQAEVNNVISAGPSAHVNKNLQLVGRGERLLPAATTDVWVLDGYAYIGTFNSPCGDGTGLNGSGIRIFDVSNRHKVTDTGFIPSVENSRANDVKVARMNSGDILVHSNESCEEGPGGFEIYNVDDPLNPQFLAHVQTDDVNPFLRAAIGFVDHGVHNLFLFKQGNRDYVSAVVESEFGNFQIFDITDPSNPNLIGFWGAEELRMAELGLDPSTVQLLCSDPLGDCKDLSPEFLGNEFDLILDLDEWLTDGFGRASSRFAHDITITDDGQRVYLSNWDAGLVLLDISDVTNPTVVSVALEPGHSDGEVNSHSAWATADGSIVVEGNEDFGAQVSPVNLLDLVPPFAIRFTPSISNEFFIDFINVNLDISFGDDLLLADDGSSEISLGLNSFPFLGTSYDSLFVNSNGNITFGSGDPTFLANSANHTGSQPRISPFFADFNPDASGSVHADVRFDRVVVTWNMVPVFPDVGSNTVQAIIYTDGSINPLPGTIDIIAIQAEAETSVIGIASGNSQPPENAIDISDDLPTTLAAGSIYEAFSPLGPSPWGGLRIWDYSDPANPILASSFDTICSRMPADEACDAGGIYSVHNVIVEGRKAYISWYSNGVLILDISDPYNPVEIARYNPTDDEFVAQNGGDQSVWGIYKEPGKPWIYGSDRNGGLYILKEFVSGSEKVGKSKD